MKKKGVVALSKIPLFRQRRKKHYVYKTVLLTEKQTAFIAQFQELNHTKFAPELRAVLDHFILFFEGDKFEKCDDCLWASRIQKEGKAKEL